MNLCWFFTGFSCFCQYVVSLKQYGDHVIVKSTTLPLIAVETRRLATSSIRFVHISYTDGESDPLSGHLSFLLYNNGWLAVTDKQLIDLINSQ